MRYVYKSSCQVTWVGCTKSCICKTFSCTVWGNEVFQYGKSFTEVWLDRNFYRLTGCVSHKSTHTSDLSYLVLAAPGSGVGHDEQVVQGAQRIHQCVCYIIRSLWPDFYNLLVTFLIGHKTHTISLFVFIYVFFSLSYDIPLVFRDFHIAYADGNCCLGGVLVTHRLNVVKHDYSTCISVLSIALVNNNSQFLLVAKEIHLKWVRIFFPVNKT